MEQVIAGCADDPAGITLPSHTAHPPVKSCYFSAQLLMNLEIFWARPHHAQPTLPSALRGGSLLRKILFAVCAGTGDREKKVSGPFALAREGVMGSWDV